MLPDLEHDADVEIVADNLRAVQAIYFACQLESMRAFQVMDRIAQLFQQGLLPLRAGKAARLLRRYATSTDRLSEHERKDLYCHALGVPVGDGGEPSLTNREFRTLWLRFVTAIALFGREQDALTMFMQPAAARVLVQRAARALATNASAHGAGLAPVIRRLSSDANLLRAVLGAPEVRSAFGARDMWQVIDQVASNELGGAVNVRCYRSLALAGSTILQWLAGHADALNEATTADTDASLQDAELIDAVEQWLAASSTPDAAVEDASAPTAGPAWVAELVNLRATVRDLLRIIGLHLEPDHLSRSSVAREAVHRPASVVLFCGAAGTGKTLAAHGLAAALARDLVRVDLHQIDSMYVGETEKHLDAVFSNAQRADAVLLLDEADALFGKRTEVQDAHDRYANIDLAALPQRLQAHEGLVILESNRVPVSSDGGGRFNQVVRFPHSRTIQEPRGRVPPAAY